VYITMEIISTSLNDGKYRQLFRYRELFPMLASIIVCRIVDIHLGSSVHTTRSTRSSPSLRMIATMRWHQYIQRHVFVRRVTRELNEAISTPPLSGSVSPPPRRVGRISHLSSFSRIYDSHPSTKSLFRCQLFFRCHCRRDIMRHQLPTGTTKRRNVKECVLEIEILAEIIYNFIYSQEIKLSEANVKICNTIFLLTLDPHLY